MKPTGADTIAAVATPPGRGGVAIVRCSGPSVQQIAAGLLGGLPEPRRAVLRRFDDAQGEAIDRGIALYFPGPGSFTGEDVLELHGHGGPVVVDMLLERVLELGARVARPGEFSERAFLNDKLDLAQAEAIADLIDSETRAAARLATRTLEGEFSRRIDALQEQVTGLRMYVEAAIDFPEEDIDFLADGIVSERLLSIIRSVESVFQSAKVGRALRDGMTLVIAGRPNAGKSSLLNALAGYGAAIVTEVPGTTRDVLREHVQIDGMPLHLVDTAGLRETTDRVEREGVARARAELQRADRVLWVFDGAADPEHRQFSPEQLPPGVPVTFVRNKADLTATPVGLRQTPAGAEIALSAATGDGIDVLRDHLRACMGYQGGTEGEFIARRRHLLALQRVLAHLAQGRVALEEQAAGEILAEELRLAQTALSDITGAFTADDLLGEIFAGFCIGK
ncbi:MAG: tRNA uridine-5-carboxymethylaminomethyl(34) synthesis GTPase MnmE [Gammaproteobacteria bacterium]